MPLVVHLELRTTVFEAMSRIPALSKVGVLEGVELMQKVEQTDWELLIVARSGLGLEFK